MRKLAAFLGIGLLICAAAYSTAHYFGTARARKVVLEKNPELGWLKQEFNLGDAEFARVCDLHAAYQPHCEEMCRRIAAKNGEIQQALAKADRVTPEIEQKLAEAAQIRAECQTAMLRHFFEVSRSMPPEQGRRYLAWVTEQTFATMHGMSAAAVGPLNEHGH